MVTAQISSSPALFLNVLGTDILSRRVFDRMQLHQQKPALRNTEANGILALMQYPRLLEATDLRTLMRMFDPRHCTQPLDSSVPVDWGQRGSNGDWRAHPKLAFILTSDNYTVAVRLSALNDYELRVLDLSRPSEFMGIVEQLLRKERNHVHGERFAQLMEIFAPGAWEKLLRKLDSPVVEREDLSFERVSLPRRRSWWPAALVLGAGIAGGLMLGFRKSEEGPTAILEPPPPSLNKEDKESERQESKFSAIAHAVDRDDIRSSLNEDRSGKNALYQLYRLSKDPNVRQNEVFRNQIDEWLAEIARNYFTLPTITKLAIQSELARLSATEQKNGGEEIRIYVKRVGEEEVQVLYLKDIKTEDGANLSECVDKDTCPKLVMSAWITKPDPEASEESRIVQLREEDITFVVPAPDLEALTSKFRALETKLE